MFCEIFRKYNYQCKVKWGYEVNFFFFIAFSEITFDGEQESEVSFDLFWPHFFKFPHSATFYISHWGNLGEWGIQVATKAQFYPENDQFANVAVLLMPQFDVFPPFFNQNDRIAHLQKILNRIKSKFIFKIKNVIAVLKNY